MSKFPSTPRSAPKNPLSLSSARKPKKRKDTVKKAKDRIQHLLHDLAILKWKDCEAKGIDRLCSGPLSADHIESRMFSNTYAEIKNIILLCEGHHIYWKKQHPKRWAALVDDRRGSELVNWLRSEARKSNRTWTLRDWLAAEEKLKEEIKKLSLLNQVK